MASLIEIETPGWNGNLVRDMEEYQARLFAGIAFHTTRAIKSPRSLWPVRTRFSRDRFIAEDTNAGEVLLFNSAPYAIHVERAAKSPHRGAAHRTVERSMQDILRRANQDADDG